MQKNQDAAMSMSSEDSARRIGRLPPAADARPLDVVKAKAAIVDAKAMVTALCKSKGEPGSREWTMSIPANIARDPDIVISRGLDEGAAALQAIEALPSRTAWALAEQKIERLERELAAAVESYSITVEVISKALGGLPEYDATEHAHPVWPRRAADAIARLRAASSDSLDKAIELVAADDPRLIQAVEVVNARAEVERARSSLEHMSKVQTSNHAELRALRADLDVVLAWIIPDEGESFADAVASAQAIVTSLRLERDDARAAVDDARARTLRIVDAFNDERAKVQGLEGEVAEMQRVIDGMAKLLPPTPTLFQCRECNCRWTKDLDSGTWSVVPGKAPLACCDNAPDFLDRIDPVR